MTRQVSLIGDEIRVDGMLVALLVPTLPPASIIGDFLDFMADPVTYMEDWFEQPVVEDLRKGFKKDRLPLFDGIPPDHYDDALDDVERAAKEFARGGLLSLSDLATVVSRLRRTQNDPRIRPAATRWFDSDHNPRRLA